jgi:hypothetical protein
MVEISAMKKILFPFALLLILSACVSSTATSVPPSTTPTFTPTSTPIATLPPSSFVYDPPFPRLGMWWPNPEEESLAAIARYNWVILNSAYANYTGQIKAINPNMLLLTSTNACELSYNPDPNADPADNARVLAIPYQWFLTQVGTTLRENVDATQTTLPVEAMTASNDSETYQLFAKGDTALIEGESVYIESVDKVNRTLTVRRGYVRPASAHAAGTRIAEHIAFWPNSWVLNISTLSPTGIADPSVGPETWLVYNARAANQHLLTSPNWDGILIDRSDPNASDLIGNSTARTIDPDQSNTLLVDYSAFDAAWNEGVRLYEGKIRQSIGLNKIIFVNWGMPNYDLLNGNNLEGFPNDNGASYSHSWTTAVFGPWLEKGSYFDWLANARQPNLTMIETYDDNSSPDATGSKYYSNHCTDPGFVPNYRKMRFGLATALLNDGYFSYEMNTNGHGSLCLMWFDEYDNAGAGRGYLGQPLGPAVRVASELITPNLVKGGDFESTNNLAAWELNLESGYKATLTRDTTQAAVGNSSARINISQTGGTDWKISFLSQPLAISNGKDYTLTFWAKAEQPGEINVWVQQNQSPWQGWIDFYKFSVSTEWQKYEIAGTSSGSDNQAQIIFGLGQINGSVWLDGIVVQEGNKNLWRRDYEHGIVLVNATAESASIPLNGAFQKINGTQDRSVNDGSTVTEVTLPPLDGIILLKP